jgi:uncharacterized protein YeaO (DUF488 family)
VTIQLKRVYQAPSKSDGTRILVDRLWPRGLSKEKARVDLWLKEVAPSTELRKWFGHDPGKWPELKRAVVRGPATLLYGAKDTEHNEAVVLQQLLDH